jgi:glutamate-5-semialdehyde dehydrogenase
MQTIARAARTAARSVAQAGAPARTAALHAAAAQIRSRSAQILEANAADLDAARMAPALLDRLRLDAPRIEAIAAAIDEVAAARDPVGAVDRSWRRPNGLVVEKRRIPLGVVLVVYESRPNVTADAFALCLRAGNACILRGGSEARASNRALADALAAGLAAAGLPAAVAQLVPTTDRAALAELLTFDGEIDLVIPRGGPALIEFVTERSRIPVLKHAKGVCHVYVDATADVAMALDICENAKAQRPGVCNAAETILVHDAIAPTFVPRLAERLGARGVEIRADDAARALAPGLTAARPEDFGAEFLDLICALRVVPSLDEAVAHIERYGSSHTEAIVTRDDAAARRFVDAVDSSTVLVNASTRFADGGALGLGAEIGISTTRLHAYGPMGAEELTTTKFVVHGDGQVRT